MEIKKVKLFDKSGNSKLLSIGSGCVIVKDNKVLLVRGKGGDKFKFPGGHITDDENFKQTAIREVQEETSLNVKIYGDPYFYLFKLDEETDILLIHYLAEIISGEPKATTEIEEIKWFDMDKIESTFDNVPLTLEFFKDKIKNGNKD